MANTYYIKIMPLQRTLFFISLIAYALVNCVSQEVIQINDEQLPKQLIEALDDLRISLLRNQQELTNIITDNNSFSDFPNNNEIHINTQTDQNGNLNIQESSVNLLQINNSSRSEGIPGYYANITCIDIKNYIYHPIARKCLNDQPKNINQQLNSNDTRNVQDQQGFQNFKSRHLQSVQNSPILVMGQDLTFTDTHFIINQGDLQYDQFLITIDEQTWQPNMRLSFINCTFQIYGNFLYSSLPIKITFQNCIFLVQNTRNLIELDYGSNYGNYSCNTNQDMVNQELILLVQEPRSKQNIYLYNLMFDNMNTSSTLINLKQSSGNVTLIQLQFQNSFGQDLLRITGPDRVQTFYQLNFLNITNPTQNDASKALINMIKIKEQVVLSNIKVDNSKITHSPALIIDTCPAIYLSDSNFTNIQLQTNDLIVLSSIQSISIDNLQVTNIILKSETYGKGFTLMNTSDTSIYNMTLKYCDFSNNAFTGYDLINLSGLGTDYFDLDNQFCFTETLKPTCSLNQYYDYMLKSCQSCPSGCSTCLNEKQCTSCQVQQMSINSIGLCQCPTKQYYTESSSPQCRIIVQTNSKLSQPQETVNSNARMEGIKTKQLAQLVMIIIANFVIKMGQKSFNVIALVGQSVRYCRPFHNNTQNLYHYYVDPQSQSQFSLGTKQHPFKNIDTPSKEVYNFMIENSTQVVHFLMRNNSYRVHHSISPIVVLNVQNYTIKPYGDINLPKPIINFVSYDYVYADSNIFTLGDLTLNHTYRRSLGDISPSEASYTMQRFVFLRSNVAFFEIDYQSLMFGDQLTTSVFIILQSINKTISYDNCSFDSDGKVWDSYQMVQLYFNNSLFNMTNIYNGFWIEVTTDCYNAISDVIIENSRFVAKQQRATSHFLYYYGQGNVIIRNNTFDNFSFLNQATRPFISINPSTQCDILSNTQRVKFTDNTLINLDQSNMVIAWNYLTAYNGQREFLIENNLFVNSSSTSSITTISSLIRISRSNLGVIIRNITVQNSNFVYGKLMEIETTRNLDYRDSIFVNTSIQESDFMVLNQIQRFVLQNLNFTQLYKKSEAARYAMNIPYLNLSTSYSQFQLRNISFTQSQSGFLKINSITQNGMTKEKFPLEISMLNISRNSLSNKDNMIFIGQIQYRYLQINLGDLNFTDNILGIGKFIYMTNNVQVIKISNVSFSNNLGQILYMSPTLFESDKNVSIFVENSKFYKNYGGDDAIMQITSNAILQVDNSTFQENYSKGRGSVLFADYQAAYAKFQNCNFTQNYAFQGGVFYVAYQSVIEIYRGNITQNFAVTGGVGYVNNNGIIAFYDQTIITRNQGLNTCILFLINSQYESLIDSSSLSSNDQSRPIISKDLFLLQTSTYQFIQQNFFQQMRLISDKIKKTIEEKSDSALQIINARLNITNSIIIRNDLLLSASTESVIGIKNTSIVNINARGQIIQSIFSKIELENITLNNISYDVSKPFFKIQSEGLSELRIINSNIYNVKGLFLYVSESQLDLQVLDIQNMTNDATTQSFFAIDNTEINIFNVSIQNISSYYVSPILQLSYNNLTIQNMRVRLYDKNIFKSQFGSVTVTNFTVTEFRRYLNPLSNGLFISNSLVFDVQNGDMVISNSNFQAIRTNYSSPAIYHALQDGTTGNFTLSIQDCKFVNNSAQQNAGAIQVKNTNLFMNNSDFIGNRAVFGNAGAIYLNCDYSNNKTCSYNILNSRFYNNQAKKEGGAISYSFYQPNIDNFTSFLNNSAVYGNDIGAFAAYLDIDDAFDSNLYELIDAEQALEVYKLENATIIKLKEPQVSGNVTTQGFSFYLRDSQDSVIISDNSSTATLVAVNSQEVEVLKSKSVIANNGLYTLDDFILVASPGSEVLLKVHSDAIIKQKIQIAYPNITGLYDNYILMQLRVCLKGEYESSDKKCIECSDGFYSLESNQKQCNECPSNAQCEQGFMIIPNEGYWRKDINATQIFQCSNSKACLSKYENQCAPGYGGNLCQSCVNYDGNWYSRQGSNVCTQSVTSIILIFMAMPSITTISFSVLNCQEIFNDGDKYFVSDLNIKCWEGLHNQYAKFVGIPIIVIWVVGLPIITLATLIKNRIALKESQNITKYGFLYVGLNHESFYWEILIHFRKIAMISINVFFRSFKPQYRALIGFIILIVYIEILQKIKPYQTQRLNDLEWKANIAAFSVFYGGLFFISEDLPSPVTFCFVILILLININFWLYLFKLMFEQLYDKIQRFLRKYIFPCRFNKIKKESKDKLQLDDSEDFHSIGESSSLSQKYKFVNSEKKQESWLQSQIQLQNNTLQNAQVPSSIYDSYRKDVNKIRETYQKQKHIRFSAGKKPKKYKKSHFDQIRTLDDTRLPMSQNNDDSLSVTQMSKNCDYGQDKISEILFESQQDNERLRMINVKVKNGQQSGINQRSLKNQRKNYQSAMQANRETSAMRFNDSVAGLTSHNLVSENEPSSSKQHAEFESFQRAPYFNDKIPSQISSSISSKVGQRKSILKVSLDKQPKTPIKGISNISRSNLSSKDEFQTEILHLQTPNFLLAIPENDSTHNFQFDHSNEKFSQNNKIIEEIIDLSNSKRSKSNSSQANIQKQIGRFQNKHPSSVTAFNYNTQLKKKESADQDSDDSQKQNVYNIRSKSKKTDVNSTNKEATNFRLYSDDKIDEQYLNSNQNYLNKYGNLRGNSDIKQQELNLDFTKLPKSQAINNMFQNEQNIASPMLDLSSDSGSNRKRIQSSQSQYRPVQSQFGRAHDQELEQNRLFSDASMLTKRDVKVQKRPGTQGGDIQNLSRQNKQLNNDKRLKMLQDSLDKEFPEGPSDHQLRNNGKFILNNNFPSSNAISVIDSHMENEKLHTFQNDIEIEQNQDSSKKKQRNEKNQKFKQIEKIKQSNIIGIDKHIKETNLN
eukprot:403360292